MQYVLEHHMTHWLKVREHHVKKINRKCDRYKKRLQLLLQRTHPSDYHDSAEGQPEKQQETAAMDTGL